MIFWSIYYIITGYLILMYLFNEKFVVNKINTFTEKIFVKLNVRNFIDSVKEKYISENKFLNLTRLMSIVVLIIYILKVDKSVDDNVKIKIYVVHLTIILNVLFLMLNRYKSLMIIIDIILLFASTPLFNITDKYYLIAIFISFIGFLMNVFFTSKNELDEIKKIINAVYVLILVVILQSNYLGNYIIPTGSMLPTIQLGDRIFSNNIIYKYKEPQIGDIISFKEPMDNKLMYTKRITGISGTTIKIDNGKVYSNDNELNALESKYVNGGYLSDTSNLYIPKKGDKITIYNVIEFKKSDPAYSKFLKPEEFYEKYKDRKTYENLIGRFSTLVNENKEDEYSYDFLMLVEGQQNLSLQILDFKYDKKNMDKMLNGEFIELKNDYYMAMGDNSEHSLDSRYFGYVKDNRIKGKLLLRWFPLNRFGRL